MLFCIVIVLPLFVVFIVGYTLCCVSWGEEEEGAEEEELDDDGEESSDDELDSAEAVGELQTDAGKLE